MFSLATYIRSFYVVGPRVPQTMLAPISVFSTMDPRFHLVWARAILLDTRAVHNHSIAPSLFCISRNVRRALLLLMIRQNLPSPSPSTDLVSLASLSSLLDRVLALIPPGRPADLSSVRQPILDLEAQSLQWFSLCEPSIL